MLSGCDRTVDDAAPERYEDRSQSRPEMPRCFGGTVLLWFSEMALATRSVGLSVWSMSNRGRWDSGPYLSIAKNGYILERCVDVANRGYCGAVVPVSSTRS